MKPKLLLAWPPKCGSCGAEISRWGDVGVSSSTWLHKDCWLDNVRANGHQASPLSSPLEGVRGGLPMILFLLLFHAGGGAAITGWFMLTRFEYSSEGAIVLLIGLAGFLAGLGGFVLEVFLRLRAETVRREIEGEGGWQPPQIE